jgi:hypothetical protein
MLLYTGFDLHSSNSYERIIHKTAKRAITGSRHYKKKAPLESVAFCDGFLIE